MLTKEKAPLLRKWILVDVSNQPLGRIASKIAYILQGKHRSTWTPHVDSGDYVVVINSKKVALTGKKFDQKKYYRHSGYPGHLKEFTAKEVLETHPNRVIQSAVRLMLPKSKLGRSMLSKMKVYEGGEHPHSAQQPETLTNE
tara:strand:- start:437 stop:862 length:426 start_codon:yes stop_codon:yes gene_type:complete